MQSKGSYSGGTNAPPGHYRRHNVVPHEGRQTVLARYVDDDGVVPIPLPPDVPRATPYQNRPVDADP